jgi:hypothetical protein
MGTMGVPQTVAVICVHAGARPHGHGRDGHSSGIAHRAPVADGRDGSCPSGSWARGGRGARDGAVGAGVRRRGHMG